MSKTFNDVKWKPFKISDIVDTMNIAVSKDYGKLTRGKTIFIGRQETNNGVQGFVKASPCENKNCITISMVGKSKAFWQQYTFAASQNILVLRNSKFNKYIAIFICSILNQYVLKKFNYGKPMKISTFCNDKIMLPVNLNNKPDYNFMEECIKESEAELKNRYKNYINSNINKFQEVEEHKSLKVFSITDLFIPQKGNQNNMNSLLDGDMPLVSAKKINNGYKAFVTPNNKKSYQGHIITLNIDGDGGAGIAYYQPCEHLLDSHVTALIPKEKNLSKYTLLYMATAITKQRDKYGHGYSIKNDRLNIFRFMLPINDLKQPDYDYMDKYMKNIEYKKLSEYLDYIK